MRTLQKKRIGSAIVILLGIGALISGYFAFSSNFKKEQEDQFKANFARTHTLKAVDLNDSPIASEAVKLVEFKLDENAVVAVVENPDILKAEYPEVSNVYKGDYLITSPQKTVIFDPHTNSVRDVSSISLYERLSKQ